MTNSELTLSIIRERIDSIEYHLTNMVKTAYFTGMHIKDARAAVTEARKGLQIALEKIETLELALREANRYEKPLRGTQEHPDKQQARHPAPSKES